MAVYLRHITRRTTIGSLLLNPTLARPRSRFRSERRRPVVRTWWPLLLGPGVEPMDGGDRAGAPRALRPALHVPLPRLLPGPGGAAGPPLRGRPGGGGARAPRGGVRAPDGPPLRRPPGARAAAGVRAGRRGRAQHPAPLPASRRRGRRRGRLLLLLLRDC
eukprot:9502738-Pyramimonas_sp.AAC.4